MSVYHHCHMQVTDGCELSCWGWELNLGPMEEQSVLLTLNYLSRLKRIILITVLVLIAYPFHHSSLSFILASSESTKRHSTYDFFLEIKPIWLRSYTVQFASFKANLIFYRAYMFSQRFRDKWPPHNSFLTLTSSTKIMCYLHNLAGSGTYLLVSSWGPKDLILSFCGCIWVWLCMWTGMTAIFFVVCCLGFSKRDFSV